MAKAKPELISALRRTSSNLKKGSSYQWGHMGSCNCGHLVQEITRLSKKEIHARALRNRSGDWNEQLIEYCPTSGLPLDEIISEMIAAGLEREDLMHLEKLSDPTILLQFPFEKRNLQHNKKEDVVRYLDAWANLLEEQLIPQELPPFFNVVGNKTTPVAV